MPENDVRVPFPKAANTPTGNSDNVLYSTRPQGSPPSVTSGRPPDVGPVQSGERNMKFINGWYQANQAWVLKVQSWDPVTAAWVTINGTSGAGVNVAANAPGLIEAELPGGDFQVVATFTTAPTVVSHSNKLRLSWAAA